MGWLDIMGWLVDHLDSDEIKTFQFMFLRELFILAKGWQKFLEEQHRKPDIASVSREKNKTRSRFCSVEGKIITKWHQNFTPGP